jgi:methionyl-tRNA formyltransferase
MAESPVKSLGARWGVPVLQPERLRRAEELERVLALQPDLIVVASYGQILPSHLLEEPKFGALNLHPSLLPRYRGPSPIAGPILEGDDITGTTLMLMTSAMDAGPILAQRSTAIWPEETAGELGLRLAGMSADLLLDLLPDWVNEKIDPAPQDEDRATYTSLVHKEDGHIRWDLPALRIARLVRAYNPWPGAYTEWRGRRLRVHKARPVEGVAEPGRVVAGADGALEVGTGEGLLAVTEVQLAGSRVMTAEELVWGHASIVGSRLG